MMRDAALIALANIDHLRYAIRLLSSQQKTFDCTT